MRLTWGCCYLPAVLVAAVPAPTEIASFVLAAQYPDRRPVSTTARDVFCYIVEQQRVVIKGLVRRCIHWRREEASIYTVRIRSHACAVQP